LPAGADGGRFGQSFFHALVGCKRLPLLDADRGEHAQRVGVHRISGFVLNDAMAVLEGGEIGRADRVERHAGNIDELHLRRMVRFLQGIHPQVLLTLSTPGFDLPYTAV
jgi:hypothetical protein